MAPDADTNDGTRPLHDEPEIDQGNRSERSAVRSAVGSWGLPVVTILAVVVGIALRFWPRSSLWLDEALSVNIAALPLSDMPGALRHDGHPPLYYFLLHYWMKLAGNSDWSVRALSGVVSVIGLPLSYMAGRRLGRRPSAAHLGPRRVGMLSVTLFAVMPFAIRYGAEARMYALVMVLVLAGYLVVDRLLTPDLERNELVASTVVGSVIAGALLWSHYWSMWLLAAVGLLALIALWSRRNEPDPRTGRRGPICLVVALVSGGLLFLPWVPTMLYQAGHTGTPWGEKFGPVSVLVLTLVDFCGGRFGIALFLSYMLVVAIVAGSAVSIRRHIKGADNAPDTDELVIGAGLQSRTRPELLVLVSTLAFGWATAAISGNTYSSRYASVVFPLFILLVAAGISVLRNPVTTVASVAVVAIIGVFGAVGATQGDRSQAGELADSIASDLAAHQGPAAVITCPDQLGVSLQRELDKHPGAARTVGPVIPFPSGGDPRFVDWVDYGKRNAEADPAGFVDRVGSGIAPGTTLYLVSSPHYRTFEGKCEQVTDLLTRFGTPEMLVTLDDSGLDESASLRVYRPS